MTDRERIIGALSIMAELYQRQMSPAALALMADDLSELTYEEFVVAAKAHRKGPRAAFWPMPGDLMAALRGEGQAEATAALATLQGAIRDVGAYRLPRFDDPLIMRAVIALGGWPEVCHMEASMLIPHFRKAYEGMHRGGRRQELEATGGFLPPAQSQPLQVGAFLPSIEGHRLAAAEDENAARGKAG